MIASGAARARVANSLAMFASGVAVVPLYPVDAAFCGCNREECAFSSVIETRGHVEEAYIREK